MLPLRGFFCMTASIFVIFLNMLAKEYKRVWCVQGMGGAVQYPKNYLKEAYKLVRQRGGICIADEVRHHEGVMFFSKTK